MKFYSFSLGATIDLPALNYAALYKIQYLTIILDCYQ